MVNPAKIEISFKDIEYELTGESKTFPKYTTSILNLANRFSQGTRWQVVGQMTELAQECPYKTYDEWKKWYLSKYPRAIEEATAKVKNMLERLAEAMKQIDNQIVKDWVEDLVLVKSFAGLNFQPAILSRLAKIKNSNYRLATPAEESKGIDGFVGTVPVSIKPRTYKLMKWQPESIRVAVLYYEKTEDAIVVDASEFLGKDGVLD